MLLSPASAGAGCARGRLLTAGHAPPGTRDSFCPTSGACRRSPARVPRRSPSVSSVLNPPARQVDPRGQRFGAGVSR